VAVALLLSFASAFIGLWVGTEFISGPWTMRTNIILGVLLAGWLPRLAQSLAWQVIIASERIGVMAVAVAAESVVKVGLVLAVGSAFGLVGLAVSSVVPMLVTWLIIVPHQVLRVSGLTRMQYLRCFERPGILGVGVVLVGVLVRMAWTPTSWPILVFDVALTGTVAVSGFLILGMTADERRSMRALLRPAGVTFA
jgi:hypothetical protein